MTLGPKVPTWRSEKYRRYVASQECFRCQIEGYSQAAHENEGKALSKKADDARLFPLCCPRPMQMGCHSIFDLGLDGSRDERREQARKWVEQMQERAKAAGWFREAA